jgi:hypothetical protein
MVQKIRVITWCRWKVYDPYDSKYFTSFTVSVLKPSAEYPVVCISMSVVTSNSRIFLRFASLIDLQKVFIIPEEYLNRVNLAIEQAYEQVSVIIMQQKAMHKMNDLAPGSQIVRTDTGEVIAEALQILKEKE